MAEQEKKRPTLTHDGWYIPESTNIGRYRYNQVQKTLTVSFKTWFLSKGEDGEKKRTQTGERFYLYADVPAEVVDKLVEAESAGKFISKSIVPVYKASAAGEWGLGATMMTISDEKTTV